LTALNLKKKKKEKWTIQESRAVGWELIFLGLVFNFSVLNIVFIVVSIQFINLPQYFNYKLQIRLETIQNLNEILFLNT